MSGNGHQCAGRVRDARSTRTTAAHGLLFLAAAVGGRALVYDIVAHDRRARRLC